MRVLLPLTVASTILRAAAANNCCCKVHFAAPRLFAELQIHVFSAAANSKSAATHLLLQLWKWEVILQQQNELCGNKTASCFCSNRYCSCRWANLRFWCYSCFCCCKVATHCENLCLQLQTCTCSRAILQVQLLNSGSSNEWGSTSMQWTWLGRMSTNLPQMCNSTQSTMVWVDDGRADSQSISQTVRWCWLQLLLCFTPHLCRSTKPDSCLHRKNIGQHFSQAEFSTSII